MEKNDSTCDPDSFRKLYDQFADSLRNFVYYKSGDTGFAEDATQESFLRLWKNCGSVPFEKAQAYLFTVANRLFLDKIKHQKVQLKFKNHSKQLVSQETPEFLMEEQEFKVQLDKAISKLPEKQRTVFLMNRVDKMKYREIAVALGISQKAVEKRMHKALLDLRTRIGKI